MTDVSQQTELTSGVTVSIIIVNYNVKDYLLQCLRSIYSSFQSENMQIIVVDNASSDNSVTELQAQFPKVEWVPLDQNIGFGRANNIALEKCVGRFTLFLNPDTVLGQDTVSVMADYLKHNTDVGLAGCRVLNADGTFQIACRRGFPTPWASFCKLFGLQSLFPKSRIFSGYNLTYLPEDQTYDVDALIGAFMIGPTALLKSLKGFDPEFFMYGEDLDLCKRVQNSGRRVTYVHNTSIVHYKGESTKRSSLNEVKVFYMAMELFSKKHFNHSRLFLSLLRLGIAARSILQRMLRHRFELAVLSIDLILINVALLCATTIRFESPFGFPSYAYPIVFIVLTLVATFSLIAVGEYVEHRPTVRRSAVGMLILFFVLSALTYFFKEFAFSRGVLLMTVGFSTIFLAALRTLISFYSSVRGSNKVRRVVLIGLNRHTEQLKLALQSAETRNTEILGVVAVGAYSSDEFAGLPVLGSAEYLPRILHSTYVDEVVLTDPELGTNRTMSLMMECSAYRTRFHLAVDYDDVVTARIINDVAGIEPTIPSSPLVRFRNRVGKRLIDLGVAIFAIPIVAMVSALRGTLQDNKRLTEWIDVARGVRSVVGLFPDGMLRNIGKPGITGLAHVGRPESLSKQAIIHLNDFYIDRFSLALDVEILMKHFLKRNRG